MTKLVKKSEKTASKTTKSSTKAAPKKYKRGALGRMVNDYLMACHDKGKEPEYDAALAIALKVMPTTKFNKYHFSWYKNKFNERMLETPDPVAPKRKTRKKVAAK